MKATIQIDLSFDQILKVVKQLPRQQQLQLSKELERNAVDTKLSQLLKIFKTRELDSKTILEEAEAVRQKIYDRQKH